MITKLKECSIYSRTGLIKRVRPKRPDRPNEKADVTTEFKWVGTAGSPGTGAGGAQTTDRAPGQKGTKFHHFRAAVGT